MIEVEVSGTGLAFAGDMFGVIVHQMRSYNVVLHLIGITFTIQAIQCYKITRISSLRNIGIIPPGFDQDQQDQKLDISRVVIGQSKQKTKDRNRTIGSGGSKAKPSVVDKIRGKTLGLK